MAKAQWYCKDCDTYGGGSPNYLSIEGHIDIAHGGGFARIEEV